MSRPINESLGIELHAPYGTDVWRRDLDIMPRPHTEPKGKGRDSPTPVDERRIFADELEVRLAEQLERHGALPSARREE